ncbi:Glutamine ABC transporter, periplasmic glutamine-binding protein (TC 3.A.1.3.2) [Streptococcus agalactiae ILRI005]|nr:Glutamine ABC transporter, periplasmic glutamine-binding protein (TC 3.A.1.3.2) [Streptococcus agalactiae ILRI005]
MPNFGYYNAETNQYEGMEIDIAKKIAKSLGVKPIFVPTTAQTREPLMDNGQIDILIATYTITPERKANYNISKAYYHDEIGFLVRKNSHIKTIKELDGKHIGVAQGATTKGNLEKYAKEHKLKFSYAQLGSFPELAISLYANRIDAFSVDKSILSGYLSPHTTILKEGFNTQEYGIATSKQDKVLIPYVNKLLISWEKDGSLKHIYQKFKLKPAKVKKE